MPGVIAFTSAAKQHREKITTLSFTPGTSASLLTSGALSSIKPYPYMRSILLHCYASVTGTGGNLNPDAPWNILQSIMVSDTNGTAIYGSPSFGGYDAMLVHMFGGYRGGTQDPRIYPAAYAASATAPEFYLRIPFEYNPRTGAGALPNMSSAATYNLTMYGNTTANIWQTAPTTNPTIACDVYLECWTLPDAQDLLGRNQMQGPPFLGTTQYVTKQSFTGLTASGANTVTLTRKGNLTRKYIQVGRNSSAARIAAVSASGSGAGGGWAPNPYEFWWDANRLTSDDPKTLKVMMAEAQPGQNLQTSNAIDYTTLAAGVGGVLVYDFSAQYGENKGSDGEGGWLATTQSSRLEFIGATWGGSSFSQLDVITIDVAPVALSNQYALDSASGKLMYPAQPEVRG